MLDAELIGDGDPAQDRGRIGLLVLAETIVFAATVAVALVVAIWLGASLWRPVLVDAGSGMALPSAVADLAVLMIPVATFAFLLARSATLALAIARLQRQREEVFEASLAVHAVIARRHNTSG